MAETYPHVNRANQYARAVVAGKIDVCRYVRLACQRHLDDLKRAKAADFPYQFSRTAAERVCVFIEEMPHTKGRWAARKEKLRLEPWQCFIDCCAFGWVHKSTGRRRFRRVYEEVPRKNGKSPHAAAIGHYMFAADGEHGAEVYSGAVSEKQAWEVYRPAKLMAERNTEYREFYGIEVGAKNMHILETGSRFEPVVGKPGDGASPSCAITDEYHEHPTPDQADTFVTGMVGREQPLWWVVTTAGSDIEGPCYRLRTEAIQVLEGLIQNEALFAIIYTLDDGDDWTTEAALRKANPNYGVSVDPVILLDDQKQAVQSAYQQNRFKTKHLNIWCQSRAAWMNMERWFAQGDSSLSEDAFRGELCFSGLDVASKHDMTSHVRIFPRSESGEMHYYVFGTHYVPEGRVTEKPGYAAWGHEGHLTLTDGEELDFEKVRSDIILDARRFRLRRLGHDQYLAVQLAQELTAAGIEAVMIPQTVKYLSDPMKWIFAHTLAGRIHHNDNPVLNWMMSNVTAKVDANDNIFPRKEHLDNKIDGVVAMLMAMYLAKSMPEPPRLKVYAI